MKRYWGMLLAILACGFLISCGSKMPSPSEQVTAGIEELKSKPAEELAGEMLGNAGLSGDTGNELAQELFQKLMSFDYEIAGETISKDKTTAEVEVKITTYQFGDAFSRLFEDLFNMALDGEIDINDEEAVSEYVMQELNQVTERGYTDTVVIHCVKDEEIWKTDLDDNEEFMNAVLGGMYEVVTSLG